jgi:hypothetical protein
MDCQIDRLVRNTFVWTGDFVCLNLNLFPNQVKIGKLLTLFVFELPVIQRILLRTRWVDVSQWKNQRTTCDDSRSSRQKVPSNNRFQNRAFTGWLRSYNNKLWQLNWVGRLDHAERTLKFYDKWDKRFDPLSRCCFHIKLIKTTAHRITCGVQRLSN